MSRNSLRILHIPCLIHFLKRMYHPQFCSTVYTFVLLQSAPPPQQTVNVICGCLSFFHVFLITMKSILPLHFTNIY